MPAASHHRFVTDGNKNHVVADVECGADGTMEICFLILPHECKGVAGGSQC